MVFSCTPGQYTWKGHVPVIYVDVDVDTKLLKTVNLFYIRWNIRPDLGPNISGTKCDRDKPILSAERGGQSDHDEA